MSSIAIHFTSPATLGHKAGLNHRSSCTCWRKDPATAVFSPSLFCAAHFPVVSGLAVPTSTQILPPSDLPLSAHLHIEQPNGNKRHTIGTDTTWLQHRQSPQAVTAHSLWASLAQSPPSSRSISPMQALLLEPPNVRTFAHSQSKCQNPILTQFRHAHMSRSKLGGPVSMQFNAATGVITSVLDPDFDPSMHEHVVESPAREGKVEKKAAKSKNNIPRPPNAFIIYRKDWHLKTVAANPSLHNNEICKLCQHHFLTSMSLTHLKQRLSANSGRTNRMKSRRLTSARRRLPNASIWLITQATSTSLASHPRRRSA